MNPAAIKPGELFADRYRVESVLGVGGHAHVYLARQEGLGRKVALKVLTALHDMTDERKRDVLIKRFEQEARMISELRDPHTVTMYDYGRTADGMFYMAQEYIEGESLGDLFKREGRLSPERVVKILQQLLLSLQEAHVLGVLHRDIKPQNIMVYTHVGRTDQIKLLDFGIAKMAGEGAEDWTAEGSLVGTPRYIAPERIRGKELTPSSDLYSLGLVACELLTGRRVMAGKKGIKALQAQLTDPSTTLPEGLMIPGALRVIINRMMEKNINRRYSVAEQVLNDLERWQDGALSDDPLVDEDATVLSPLSQEELMRMRAQQAAQNKSAAPLGGSPTMPMQSISFPEARQHTPAEPDIAGETREMFGKHFPPQPSSSLEEESRPRFAAEPFDTNNYDATPFDPTSFDEDGPDTGELPMNTPIPQQVSTARFDPISSNIPSASTIPADSRPAPSKVLQRAQVLEAAAASNSSAELTAPAALPAIEPVPTKGGRASVMIGVVLVFSIAAIAAALYLLL